MKKIIILSATLSVLSATAWADLKFVKFEGNQFADVSTDAVQSVCSKNFVFREEFKDQVPKYLVPEVLKAAFKGKLLPSLDTLRDALKASPGSCGWVSAEERGQLK